MEPRFVAPKNPRKTKESRERKKEKEERGAKRTGVKTSTNIDSTAIEKTSPCLDFIESGFSEEKSTRLR